MPIKNINIDFENSSVTVDRDGAQQTADIGSPEGFSIISEAMLRTGWDNKYVYSFSWLGRPVIQLPDDMIRIQELIYTIKPDVILETGVAHGGSLVYYASLLNAIGHGRVIGVDIEIREHNRQAIEAHRMYEHISLLEGSSTSSDIILKLKSAIKTDEKVLVFLDANHTKEHVLEELNLYSHFVPVGSYIVAMDGIMKDMVGAPRANTDWGTNNPYEAAKEFVANNDNFIINEPEFPFNEGHIQKQELTYWPGAYIKRISE